MTTRFPSPIPTVPWATPKTNLNLSFGMSYGFSHSMRASQTPTWCCRVKSDDERGSWSYQSYTLTEKADFGLRILRALPRPKDWFPLGYISVQPPVEACWTLDIYERRKLSSGSLAPSEMWATGSELYCESTETVMTQGWERVCVCVCVCVHAHNPLLVSTNEYVIEKEMINWKLEKQSWTLGVGGWVWNQSFLESGPRKGIWSLTKWTYSVKGPCFKKTLKILT